MATVSSSLPQVSFVYQSIEMIQPGKSQDGSRDEFETKSNGIVIRDIFKNNLLSNSSRVASQIDRCEKQWLHYLNKIFIVLEHLVWSTDKV